MKREEVILAAMAAGGPDAEYTPIKIQSLMFIIDREMAEHLGGPFFNFVPHYYGPFDDDVYQVLDDLASKGWVRIDTSDMARCYFLSVAGYEQGRNILSACDEKIGHAFRTLAKWILPRSLSELRAAIHQSYPDIRTTRIDTPEIEEIDAISIR